MNRKGRHVIAYHPDGTVKHFDTIRAASLEYRLHPAIISKRIEDGKPSLICARRRWERTPEKRAETEGVTFDVTDDVRGIGVEGVPPGGETVRWPSMNTAMRETGMPRQTLMGLMESGRGYVPKGRKKEGYEKRERYKGWRFRRIED